MWLTFVAYVMFLLDSVWIYRESLGSSSLGPAISCLMVLDKLLKLLSFNFSTAG